MRGLKKWQIITKNQAGFRMKDENGSQRLASTHDQRRRSMVSRSPSIAIDFLLLLLLLASLPPSLLLLLLKANNYCGICLISRSSGPFEPPLKMRGEAVE